MAHNTQDLTTTSHESTESLIAMQSATMSVPSNYAVGTSQHSTPTDQQNVSAQAGNAMMIMPRRPIPEFLFQLTQMLSDSCNHSLIEWSAADRRIVVHDPITLEKDVLQKYFRHSKYSSFQRQLNYFGFRKNAGKGRMSPCSYENDSVSDDLRSLLFIKRKTQGVAAMAAKKDKRANKTTAIAKQVEKKYACQNEIETSLPDTISSTEQLSQGKVNDELISASRNDVPTSVCAQSSENLHLPAIGDIGSSVPMENSSLCEEIHSLFAHHQCNVPNPLLQPTPAQGSTAPHVSPSHSPCPSNDDSLPSNPLTRAVSDAVISSQNNISLTSDNQPELSLGFLMAQPSWSQPEDMNITSLSKCLSERLPSSEKLFPEDNSSIVSLDDSDCVDTRDKEMAYLLNPSSSFVDLAALEDISRA